MTGGDLDIAQVHAGVEHGGDESVPEHMGMHAARPDVTSLGQLAKPARGGVPVHPGAPGGAEDRPGRAAVDGSVDGTLDGRRERGQDHLSALTADLQYTVAVLLTEVLDVGSARLEIRSPSRPSMATRAKSLMLPEVFPALSMASN